MSQKTIEVEHLSKMYGATEAIKDVHFSVEAGEVIGFLGPNGAGKTTTMRILAGYLSATAGTARIAGYDVHRQSMQARRHLGYLPETPPLYPEMTVKGYLDFVAKIKGIRAGDRQKQVKRAIKRCQLDAKAKVAIRKLSKGYRQRVGIAQAIVHEPAAIILDEPTVGLDPRQIIEVRNLIKSLAGEHTIILSTHILPEANAICDRVTIINRGRVVTTNTPGDLTAQLENNSGYELEVGGNITSTLPLLRQLPGIIRVTCQSGRLNEANHHLIQITHATDISPGKDIAATIVKQGLDLYELRRTRPSLEDVFLELTTEESLANNLANNPTSNQNA